MTLIMEGDDHDAVDRMRASKQAYQEKQRLDGYEAGISFAMNADYEDLVILRSVVANNPDDDDLLDMLFNEYSDRCDYCAEEFKEHLFGNEDAEPSEHFVGAFVRAALEKLEDIAKQAEQPMG
jgi:hypothetical protein